MLYKHAVIPLVEVQNTFFYCYVFIFCLFSCTMYPSNHPGYPLMPDCSKLNRVIPLQPSRIQPILSISCRKTGTKLSWSSKRAWSRSVNQGSGLERVGSSLSWAEVILVQKWESHFVAEDGINEPAYDNSQKSWTALTKHLSVSGISSQQTKGLKAAGAVVIF